MKTLGFFVELNCTTRWCLLLFQEMELRMFFAFYSQRHHRFYHKGLAADASFLPLLM